jgi:hypothetical protein
VQRRRQWPTRVTQWLQVVVQRRVITRALRGGSSRLVVPPAVRLLARCSLLQRLPARLIGVGVRAEHISRAPR